MRRKNLQRILLAGALLLVSGCVPAFGQKAAVSSNLLQYANMGTLNGDVSLSLARRWSVQGGFRYNPFTYTNSNQEQMQSKQRAFSLGARFWPWHVYSGWWMGPKGQFQQYNTGGIRSPETREGSRMGVALMGGYSYMIGPHLDVEFGVGVWGGWDRYRKYACPVCGLTVGQGQKPFLLPDDVMLALTYIF